MAETDSQTKMEDGRFDLLVQQYLSESLEPAEAEELRLLLENQPGLAERFFGQFEVDALLRDAATADRVSPFNSNNGPTPSGMRAVRAAAMDGRRLPQWPPSPA